MNALRGVDSKWLDREGVTVHYNITSRDGMPANYVIQGYKEDIIRFAEELLRDEGYSLIEPGEDPIHEE